MDSRSEREIRIQSERERNFSLSETWDSSISDWVNESKYEAEYDESGNLLLEKNYVWSNNEWEETLTIAYYYSLKGSSLESDKQPNLQIYPNPTTEGFYVRGLNNDNGLLMLYDLSGRIHLNKQIADGDFIDITNFPKGIYLAKIRAEGVTLDQKIIKQ